MMLRDEAHLAGGRARAVDDQNGLDRGIGRQRGVERAPRLVVADHADEDAARAERGDIARHVAGAADHEFAVADGEHLRRRLGRDAGDLAVDEIVEHDVADAEHGLPADKLQRLVEMNMSLAFSLLRSPFNGSGRGGRGNR